MATSAIAQVLASSVDSLGLSTLSATMTAATPRAGSMYSPSVLAAGVPVWFHPRQDGNFVALFQSHWTGATVGTAGPQSYTAHTEVSTPTQVTVTPPGGGLTSLGPIPTRLPGDDFALNGAASRTDFLFTVGSLGGSAIVQHHRISNTGVMLLASEELLPPVKVGTDSVIFDKGAHTETTGHLVLSGTDSTGALYQARRSWSRIGASTDADSNWEYRGSKGWLSDPASLEPIGLSSAGPVSVTKSNDKRLISVVSSVTTTSDTGPDTTAYSGQIYTARLTDPFGSWKAAGDPVALGDADTYLGGGLYLQPQLPTNPAATLPPGSNNAVPYVTSVRSVTDTGEHSIATAWGLWPL